MVGYYPQIVPEVSCRTVALNIGKVLGHLCYVEGFLVTLKDLVHRRQCLYDLS